MINRILIVSAVLLLLAHQSAFGATPKKVQGKMVKAIKTEAAAQKKADDWGVARQDAIDEIRELITRIAWLNYQQGKHENYIEGVHESIKQLEYKKLQARTLREQLEPYMEDVVARLDAFIASDLPFEPDERQQRLKILRITLDNYRLSLGEKLRRVMESLSVEATYGKMVSASEETLDLDGTQTQANVIRLGRVAMYYQSLDGLEVGQWNQESQKWEQLSKNFERDVRYALEMARRERTANLIQLPLGAVAK